jgi:site-specific DNA recombinase
VDKAAIYCRLSKEDVDRLRKGDDSESIQNQKMLLMDYAMQHNMMIYRIYCDEDYSGTDKDRPEWKRMLVEAKKGEFNVILCKTQSRFTRELETVEKYIHGLFLEWGIRFIGVVDKVDTNIEGNKKARQINGLVNEWYLEDLSNNIKAVFRKKMEAGQFLGAFAPYGYQNDPKDRHRLIIDEEAAKVVRRIFDLYKEGYSIKRICYILTELHIPTPTAYKQGMGYTYKNPNSNSATSMRGVWGPSTVRRILTNTTYLGVLTQGKEKKLSYKSKKVVRAPESEWIIIENNHEAIIERSTFEQVQRMLEAKRTVSGDTKGNGKFKAHCLAGKVKCPDCGSSLIKTGGGGSQDGRYLRCQLASKTRNRFCTPHSIRFNILRDLIAGEIRELFNSVLNADKVSCLEENLRAISDVQDGLETRKKERNSINRTLQDNKEALSSLYMDKVKGVITEAEYLIHKEKFVNTISEQQTKLELLKNEIEQLRAMKLSRPDILSFVKRCLEFEELTGEMVADMIDYIEVGEKDAYGNQEVHIYWNV